MTQTVSIGLVPRPHDFKYARIADMGRPVHEGDYFSIRHSKMNCAKRAKIFAPFAALRGFDFEILCKDVRYEEKRELTVQKTAALNETLLYLQNAAANRHMVVEHPVTVTAEYYIPCSDVNHEAYRKKGSYIFITGIVQYVDAVAKTIRIDDTVITFEDLYGITLSSPQTG